MRTISAVEHGNGGKAREGELRSPMPPRTRQSASLPMQCCGDRSYDGIDRAHAAHTPHSPLTTHSHSKASLKSLCLNDTRPSGLGAKDDVPFSNDNLVTVRSDLSSIR